MATIPGQGVRPGSHDELDLYRRLVDHLPAMVAFWDADARNVVANIAYVEWFGWRPEDLRGRHISELLGEDLYAKNLPFITAALAGEEQLFDRTLVDTLGRTRHTQAHYVPEVVEGRVKGFFVLVADVTAHVEAQRELAEVQHLAQVGSWTEYRLTGELTWSEGLYRIFGLPSDQPPSRETVLAMIPAEDRDAALAVAQRGIDAAEDTESHFRVVRPDGEVRYVHGRTTVVVRDGVVVARRGTLVDETDTQRSAQELAEANRRLSDLVGVIGHDVRTPATALRGFLDLARESLARGDVDRAAGLLERAQGAAQRLDDLLANILSMAKLDAGDVAARRRTVHVQPVVGAVLADLAGSLEVGVDLEPDLTVLVEPGHLQLVLANLLSNARKYGAPPVTLRGRTVDGACELRVEDHGDGVPEEFQAHLFDRFARAESGATASQPGTGLGLYIVRRVVEANGGSVRHEPGADGQGSSFVVVLPRA